MFSSLPKVLKPNIHTCNIQKCKGFGLNALLLLYFQHSNSVYMYIHTHRDMYIHIYIYTYIHVYMSVYIYRES